MTEMTDDDVRARYPLKTSSDRVAPKQSSAKDGSWPNPDVSADNFVGVLRAFNLEDRMTGLEQAVQPVVQPPSVLTCPLMHTLG